MVTVIDSGDHSSMSKEIKCNNQLEVRSNNSSMWENSTASIDGDTATNKNP